MFYTFVGFGNSYRVSFVFENIDFTEIQSEELDQEEAIPVMI